MIKSTIPLLSFVLLSMLAIPIFSLDNSSFVVPGWHFIFPSNKIPILLIFILTLLSAIAYFLLKTKGQKMAKNIFLAHLLLSLPAIFITRVPFMFLMARITDFKEIQRQFFMGEIILYLSYTLFLVGQIIFAVYFIKTFLQKQHRH